MSNDGIVPLSPAQLAQIRLDAASAFRQAITIPGLWAGMYSYIADNVSGLGPDQSFWFPGAAAVNAANLLNPAGFFIRDVTKLGMGLSSLTDPMINQVSNDLGLSIYSQISQSKAIPAFATTLTTDVTTSLIDAGLNVGQWGGAFYYWNNPFNPSGEGDPDTTIGQYIMGNSAWLSNFITNDAQAMVDLLNQFPVGNIQSDPQAITQVAQAIIRGLSNFTSSFANIAVAGRLLSQFVSDGGLMNSLQEILQAPLFGPPIFAGSGNADLSASFGSEVLVGGQLGSTTGNDTLNSGNSNNTFMILLPSSGTATETINDATGSGNILLVSNGVESLLGGQTPVHSNGADSWEDTAGVIYQFNDSTDQLSISGGSLGSSEILVDNFNIEAATSGATSESLGLDLANIGTLNFGASAGGDPPAPSLMGGSSESFTFSVDSGSATSQSVVVTLSGASPVDFGVLVDGTLQQLNPNGTFDVILPAGEDAVSFTLIDETAANPTSDIAHGATLTLTASIASLGGSSSLSFDYVPEGSDTAPAPQPDSTIAGSVSGGEMIYNGDGLDDYINATGTYNVVNAQNSGNDSIVGGPGTNIITGSSGNSVINLSSAGSADQITLGTGFNTLNGSAGGHDSIYSTSGDQLISGNGGTDVIELGDGNNQVYAGSQTSLANAIATAFINGVLALLLPWSVLTLYGCQKNVAPGDPDYPIASDHPTQVVDLTIIDPASTKLEFNVSYAGWGGGRCTYQRAGEVSAPYSVVEPLLMTRSADVLRGQVILDKFLPGRCGWAFVGAFYKTAIGSNTTYELLRVDPSKVTPRADVYCEKDVDGSAICNSALVWSQMLKGPITKLQYDALVLSGSANPAPAYIATGTRSVLIQFHDLDAPDRGRTAISQ